MTLSLSTMPVSYHKSIFSSLILLLILQTICFYHISNLIFVDFSITKYDKILNYFSLKDIDFFSDDENEKDLMGELNPDAGLDDGQQTDNCMNEGEESSSNVQYPVISDSENVVRSAGPVNGRKPGPDSKAAKISAFNNNPIPSDDMYPKKS